MRKFICIAIIITTGLVGVLASADQAYLASLHQVCQTPTLPGFGRIYDRYDTEPLRSLSQAFSSPYSLQWTETNIAADKRKALTYLYGDMLAEILPMKGFRFSEPKRQNDAYAVSVSVGDRPLVLDLLVDAADSRILSITPRE